MSTQQILGVVGGVVGSFFGYPQLGFVVGSLVGGLLTPGEKTEGPRVDDLKVQVSTYGAGIPILYGTERIGGNVVWSTDKIEIEETQGGKGSPEQTTYRYYVHMGIVLCETPRDGSVVEIIQIFQDGKLIYDARSGIPVGSALASEENPNAYFVLYQGHSDQLPDPGEEAWMGGPGSVPAYRGVVRIRMNAIECPGGRVPQFSFVLSASASSASTIQTFNELTGAPIDFTGIIGPNAISHVPLYRQGGAIFLSTYEIGVNYAKTLLPQRTEFESSGVTVSFVPVNGTQEAASSAYSFNTGSGMSYNIFDNLTGGVINLLDGDHVDDGRGEISAAAYDIVSGLYAFSAGLIGKLILFPGDFYSPVYDGVYQSHSLYNSELSIAYVKTGTSAQFNIATYRLESDSTWSLLREVVVTPYIGSGIVMLYHSQDGLFCCADIDGDLSFFSVTDVGVALLGSVPNPGDDISIRTFFSNENYAIYGPSYEGSTARYFMIRHRPLSIADARVSDIIADQCARAGEDRIDLSAIPDTNTVHGYKLQNPASARSNIDPLLTAFAAFIVDEDGLIKFRKYEDIVSVATIGYDELGQAEDGSEAPDAMPLNRAQEIDLPRSVSASYIEPLQDYQTATEKEVRQITEANEDMIVELPIATTSNHAKRVASLILFNRWRSQNTRSLKTSRKYAFVSPGDGLTIEYPKGTERRWRVTKATDTGVLCEFDVEPGDAELYTQTAIGATGYTQQEVSPLAPPTQLQLLDIPILRDQDNNAGIYAALAGYGSPWPGGELFVGDDDATLQSRGTVQNQAPMGFSESALGSWSLGVIDETNLLTVNVGHHLLSSITQEVLLTGAENVAALGAAGRWEIIKFQRAASLGAGRYVLSGLLRGQRGTEWARSLHQPNDVFVVLAIAGVLRPNMDAGSIGQTKSYRAVTKGRSLNSVSSQSYANAAEGLETFAPVNFSKSQSGADIIFSWGRRTRLSENFLTGIVPLGEASERYDVVLYTSNTFTTVRRVIASTTRSATYSAAMQAEDGYTTGPLYIRVFQLSDIVGRGHPLEEII